MLVALYFWRSVIPNRQKELSDFVLLLWIKVQMQVRDSITLCWNFLNPCGFNNGGNMLYKTGQSSWNTDVPQRNQPSVATTSWSRQWNSAQGEIFCYSFWIHTFRISLILLWGELSDFDTLCYTGRDAFVFAAYWILGRLKWVNLTLTIAFDFAIFASFNCLLNAFSHTFFYVPFAKKKACKEALKSILTCACESPVSVVYFWWSFFTE